MNPSTPQLDALRRIVSQVRTFREDPENLRQGAYSEHLSYFLKQRLDAQDYEMWEALELDWEMSK